jgi:hypothetical protein
VISEVYFLKNTRSIRNALSLTWDDYIDAFGMKKEEAEKLLLNPREFPLKFAMNFCERFSLDLENIFSADFDEKTFARNYLGEMPQLPEKYTLERNSRVITLANFVAGLENGGHGWLNELIFRRMQIPRTILLYPEMRIPFKLILDYLNLVEKFRTNPQIMYISGLEGIDRLNHKLGLKTFSDQYNIEFYEKFFHQSIQSFDNTYNYEVIDANQEQILVKWNLKEEFQELYKTKSMSNDVLLNYKVGIASGIASLFGLENSNVDVIKNENGVEQISIQLSKQSLINGTQLH